MNELIFDLKAEVVELAANGARPHCPGGSAVVAFVEDSATRVTYCGPYNR